jgi:hypothetical protein
MRLLLLLSLVVALFIGNVAGDYATAAPDNVIVWHAHDATDKIGTKLMSLLVPALKRGMTPQLYVVPETATAATVMKTIHLTGILLGIIFLVILVLIS